MQVTIDIEPRTYLLLEKMMKDEGLTLDEVLRDTLDKFEVEEHPQRKMTSDEWIRSLKEWASKQSEVHSTVTDEILSRERLYGS